MLGLSVYLELRYLHLAVERHIIHLANVMLHLFNTSLVGLYFAFLCYRPREKERTPDLHEIPNPRVGERVPFQPISHPEAENRNRACSVPDGKTD